MSWRDELKTPGIEKRGQSPQGSDASSGPSLWTKCLDCGVILYRLEIEKNHFVCLKCQFHFAIPSRKRLELLLDPDSFVEFDADLSSADPLKFVDQKSYKDRLSQAKKKASEPEAMIWGEGKIENYRCALAVFEFEFMGGSMGAVVGEKLTRCFEYALKEKIPAIVFSSSGGARMQEGIFSLMQMAKSCAALQRWKEAGIPYVSVLTTPTTGGVAASFAMLGDVQIAEPEALIGFAGPRVIEQTIRQKLPEGFQRPPFLLKNGIIDAIVPRKDQRAYLANLFYLLRSRIQKPA
jgi:acetyl-CoA carboxylase carboxyl transferase subunit beta